MTKLTLRDPRTVLQTARELASGRSRTARLVCDPAEITVTEVVPGQVVTVTTHVRLEGAPVPASRPEVVGPGSVPVTVAEVTSTADGCRLRLLVDTRRLGARRRMRVRLSVRWAGRQTPLVVRLVTSELAEWTDHDGRSRWSPGADPFAAQRDALGWPWRGRSRALLLVHTAIGGFVVPLVLVAWALGRLAPGGPHPFAAMLAPPAAGPVVVAGAFALAAAATWALVATGGLLRIHAVDATSRRLAATAVATGLAARWVAAAIGAAAAVIFVIGATITAVTFVVVVAASGALLVAMLLMIGRFLEG